MLGSGAVMVVPEDQDMLELLQVTVNFSSRKLRTVHPVPRGNRMDSNIVNGLGGGQGQARRLPEDALGAIT